MICATNTGAEGFPYVGSVAEWVWLWDRFTLCGMIWVRVLIRVVAYVFNSPTFDINTLVSLLSRFVKTSGCREVVMCVIQLRLD